VVIDANLEEAAAYTFLATSRARVKLNDRKDMLLRDFKRINNHSLATISVRDLGFGITPRMFLGSHSWQRLNENEVIVVGETKDSTNTGYFDKAYIESKGHLFKSHVVAKGQQYWHLKKIDNNCTRLTFINQVDLGGFIPQKAVDSGSAMQMDFYAVMRRQFSRDFEIDKASREVILEKLKLSSCEKKKMNKSEADNIQRARDKFRAFQNSMGNKKMISTSDEFISVIGCR